MPFDSTAGQPIRQHDVLPSAARRADSAPAPARVPRRFYVGILLLLGVFVGTLLLALSPLHRTAPHWETVVPILAGGSFYLIANLLLIIFGRGKISRWVVLACCLCTLVLTALLCLTVRARLLYPAVDADSTALRAVLRGVAAFVERVLPGAGTGAGVGAGRWTQFGRFLGMIVIEEAVKLLPLMVLIAAGRIRSAQAAMLCGALSGLTFGVVEGITLGYLEYPGVPSPITTYLTRFLVMAPQHGVWDALAGGIIFFIAAPARAARLSRAAPSIAGGPPRRPTARACAIGCVWAVIFHLAHNGMQALFGPTMQVATALGLLAPLYLLARAARRRSAAEGAETTGGLGDLHALTIALATIFLSGSVAFSRTAARTARLLEDEAGIKEAIAELDSARTLEAVNAARATLLKLKLTSGDLELAKVRESVLAAAATFDVCDRKYGMLSPGWSGFAACRWGADGVPQELNETSMACRWPGLLLNDCRMRLNRWSARRGLDKPYSPARRWRITLSGWSVSAAAAARCDGNGEGEQSLPDPYVIIVAVDPSSPGDMLALARTQSTAHTRRVQLSPPWSREICFWQQEPLIVLADMDGVSADTSAGSAAKGELLDAAPLPARDFAGDLTLRDGSVISLKLEYAQD